MAIVTIVTVAVVDLTAQPAFAYPAKPATDTSYYITTSNTTTAYNDGCNQSGYDKQHAKNSRVVIAFGAQKSDFTGNYLPATAAFISKANVEAVAEQFALGYWVCADLTHSMYLGLSTNNDGSTVTYSAGQAWGSVINDVKAWVSTHAQQVIIEGANDIEPSWSTYSAALAWANGYQATTSALYMDTASADGCPQTTHTNGSCNNGWNQFDCWNITWGLPSALAVPQIYFSSQAKQWEQISLYGYYSQGQTPILFSAPLDEYPADSSTFTSQQAWDSLLSQMYSSSATAYGPGYSMEIRYE